MKDGFSGRFYVLYVELLKPDGTIKREGFYQMPLPNSYGDLVKTITHACLHPDKKRLLNGARAKFGAKQMNYYFYEIAYATTGVTKKVSLGGSKTKKGPKVRYDSQGPYIIAHGKIWRPQRSKGSYLNAKVDKINITDGLPEFLPERPRNSWRNEFRFSLDGAVQCWSKHGVNTKDNEKAWNPA